MTVGDKYEVTPSSCFLASLSMNMRAWDKVLWVVVFLIEGVWTEALRWSTCGRSAFHTGRQLMCLFLLSSSVFSIMRPTVGGVCVCCRLVPVLFLVLVCPLAAGYNLDLEHSLEFTGPSSSMFGYSVLLHHHGAHNWSGSVLLAFFFIIIIYLDL